MIKTTEIFDEWFAVQDAFDSKREGILLCAGNKVGQEKQFCDVMILLADAEFARYLDELNKKE